MKIIMNGKRMVNNSRKIKGEHIDKTAMIRVLQDEPTVPSSSCPISYLATIRMPSDPTRNHKPGYSRSGNRWVWFVLSW